MFVFNFHAYYFGPLKTVFAPIEAGEMVLGSAIQLIKINEVLFSMRYIHNAVSNLEKISRLIPGKSRMHDHGVPTKDRNTLATQLVPYGC